VLSFIGLTVAGSVAPVVVAVFSKAVRCVCRSVCGDESVNDAIVINKINIKYNNETSKNKQKIKNGK
jgi:hypothetical protein